MRQGLIFLVFLLFAGVQLHAEQVDAPVRTLVTGDDSRGWTAVGRLNVGPGSFCTAALIEENLVLTAAHCVFDLETGARIPDEDILFLADWRGGRAAAERQVARSIVHPNFVLEEATFVDRVAYDVALLELEAPIRNRSITPFEVREEDFEGTEVGLVSYAHDRAQSPGLQHLCYVIGRQSGSFVMSCEVDFGSSGAPIFAFDDGVPQIVSVVSAKARVEDQRVSLGASLTGPLEELLAMREDTPKAQTLPKVRRLAEDVSVSGARFLRP